MPKISGRGRDMTTALAMTYEDGIVIGTDMKVTRGGMKERCNKLMIDATLGKCPLVVAVAGRLRHTTDALTWLELDKMNETLGETASFEDFLDQIVEARLPQFASDYGDKYGEYPDISMIVGWVDRNKKPHLVEIYDDGDYDYRENFAAIGSGAIFGEILLRKLHDPKMNLSTAQRLIGYIIWEIQEIDNDSGEHMQIVQINSKRKLVKVDDIEIEVYKHLPKMVTPSYDAIRDKIENAKLDSVKEQVKRLQEVVHQASTK